MHRMSVHSTIEFESCLANSAMESHEAFHCVPHNIEEIPATEWHLSHLDQLLHESFLQLSRLELR